MVVCEKCANSLLFIIRSLVLIRKIAHSKNFDFKMNNKFKLTNVLIQPVFEIRLQEVASMAMNDLDLTNSFPNTFSQIDQTVLQDITKADSDRLNDGLDAKIQANVRQNRKIIKFSYIILIYKQISRKISSFSGPSTAAAFNPNIKNAIDAKNTHNRTTTTASVAV